MIRDRIKELRRVRASELKPNPKNWRLHPERQRRAMRGVLKEIGFADAVLVRELEDGTLMLVDGHLRAEIAPEAVVPALVLDLNEQEADTLLASFDSVTALAETDGAALAELLAGIESGDDEMQSLVDHLEEIARQNGVEMPALFEAKEIEIPRLHQVVVECGDEEEQRAMYERLRGEGFSCRLLTL
jgi:hypothetical protein